MKRRGRPPVQDAAIQNFTLRIRPSVLDRLVILRETSSKTRTEIFREALLEFIDQQESKNSA